MKMFLLKYLTEHYHEMAKMWPTMESSSSTAQSWKMAFSSENMQAGQSLSPQSDKNDKIDNLTIKFWSIDWKILAQLHHIRDQRHWKPVYANFRHNLTKKTKNDNLSIEFWSIDR